MEAKKNNLRKLSFLGFGTSTARSNDGSSNAAEVQLDDECAKVFAMDCAISPPFDIYRLHNTPSSNIQRQYTEKDFNQHQNRNYPHTHVPLKIGSKSMRRRTLPRISNAPNESEDIEETPEPTEEENSKTISESIQTPPGDSSTGLLSSLTLQEESVSEEEESSESECVLSDPGQYTGVQRDSSPERKVQFNDDGTFQFLAATDKDASKTNKHKRRQHHTFRKFSLPVEVISRKRNHEHRTSSIKNRRISTPTEDLPLVDADRDQLDSHRSDNAKSFRRHRTSRPSNASLVHIARKDGIELHPSLKKMYDHSPHAIFVELGELFTSSEEREWKETARWIKYEEDVEEGVDRWGKPHVASLSFHSLLNLRKCLEDGLVLLDLEERDLPGIAYRISEGLFKEDLIRDDDKVKIMRALLLRHRHVNEYSERGFRFSKKHSYTSLQNLHEVEKRSYSVDHTKNGHIDVESKLLGPDHQIIEIKDDSFSASSEDVRKVKNEAILKKIPAGAQGSSVLVGEVDFLEQPAIAFIRLAEGITIPSLIEVNIPVRFIFMLLGPKRANLDYHEVGRSISTLMANQQFHNIAYGAFDRKALLSAINEFLDDSIVLPPGDWERQALLPIEELKAKSDAIRRRKENALKKAAEAQGIVKPLLGIEGGEKKPLYPSPLERTKKPWGGLINDLKRRYPYYKSDIVDAFNAQCAAASIFIYFAALSAAVAFGGIMSDKTENSIGTCETLLATCVSGIIFAIFSGQPMMIVGTTGPLLLFDESLYQLCVANGIEFLTTRVYIGFWLAIIGLIVSCFEGSVLVKLFTRFTEDIFSALIVLLYIIESVMKLFFVYGRHPILENYCEYERVVLNNSDNVDNKSTLYENSSSTDLNGAYENVETSALPQADAYGPINQPNTALFCTILTLGTFIIAYYLKMFRNSQFLGRNARRALGDFGVPIAIVTMVFVDYMIPQTYTEKLQVPEGLSPSNPDERGWVIPPSGINQAPAVWVIFASVVPAMLVYILLFMETHITELIIDKKERKLKKGSGFHLDIVLVCLTNIISGSFGLPWVCVANVRSITHVSALTCMSRTHAPGEKPHLIEVKEQRVTALTVSVLIGLSVLMSPLLRLVPMAVLFGIFLYMGAASVEGIQFFDRIKLLFMPVKHHPQASYVRRVKTGKMHLFTFIQLMCLVILWIVKSTKASLAFPFFLVLMIPLRAQLTHIFSGRELRALDGDQQPDVDDDEPDFYAEAPLPG